MNHQFGVLNGIDSASAQKLITLINSLSDSQAQIVMDAVAKSDKAFVGSDLSTGRGEYIARIMQLPPELTGDLTKGVQQLVDMEFYSVVALGSSATSITDVFPQAESKAVGLRNVANQKLDAGVFFLLTHIELMYGIDASNSGKSATFINSITPAALMNGEIEMTQSGRTIIQKQSLAMFWNGLQAAYLDTTGKIYQRKMIAKLPNPKWMNPQEEIKCRMEWGVASGEVNSYLKLRLIGVGNTRA